MFPGTKFQIRRPSEFIPRVHTVHSQTPTGPGNILTLNDEVTVRALGQVRSGNPLAAGTPITTNGTVFLHASQTGDMYDEYKCIQVVSTAHLASVWSLRSLFEGNFGVVWAPEDATGAGASAQLRPFVVWTPDNEGDEWELV